MLKEKLKKHIQQLVEQDSTELALYKEEIESAYTYHLLTDHLTVIEKDPMKRYDHGYIERTDKDSLKLIAVETIPFLQENISLLKDHPTEFVYIESLSFDMLGIDAISLEIDDVFQTYTALLGLKAKKKYEQAIKNYLDTHLSGDEGRFSIAYSTQDHMWDINFSLTYVDGFTENLTLQQACDLAYSFVFSMAESLEGNA